LIISGKVYSGFVGLPDAMIDWMRFGLSPE
jgi:hypothetical protein